MFLVFQFIHHRHGVVFHGNVAVAVLIHDKVIFAQTELSCPLPGFKRTCRREENPVNVLFTYQCVQVELAERLDTAHDGIGDST